MSEFNFDFDAPNEEPVTPVVMDLAVPDTYEQFIANVDAYELAVKDALERLKAIQVSFDTDPEPVVETAAVIARLDKAIAVVADIKKKPHQDIVNAVNKATKRIRDNSAEGKRLCKQIISQIRNAQKLHEERLRQEAEERDKQLQAALEKEAKKLGIETPELPKTVVETHKVTRTETGASSHFRKDVKVDITDILELMRACADPKDKRIEINIQGRPLFSVDKALLKDLYKAGRRNIPGVKFTEIETPIIRT